ncbi:MAG: hypothetical protein COU09_00665 [Candidatus Harrisonbacteria bacterium CG10_big_fil_rev_8_21_14_0_10_44_23]|uniref:Adenylate kinase n=1 Tax=Candidatus Harrisonbacteria bacterium CG10_big_fil_rev_8_21_14_0_10_44_23 TaxID=1974585 RepID=A0A2H0UQR0_9BACT|nr:MAG: hypothetical protein COU09_00665 [Candidatus Harrisonbacteria bacterium CG10_big_fil_rev_8_21_14_0_10_44_23]
MNKKIAVVIFGPPGSGKGTQADLLAEKFGLNHINTGKLIEKVVHDPQYANNEKIQDERKKYDSGVLVSPSWALELVSRFVNEYAAEGKGVIFSGSPRTMDEAKGMDGNPGLIEVLEQVYGKEGVFPFEIKLSNESSIRRNSSRWICIPTGKPVRDPSECDGEVQKRTDDKPEVIKDRLVEYETRTLPVVEEFNRAGLKVFEIDGEPEVEEVHKQFMSHFDGHN